MKAPVKVFGDFVTWRWAPAMALAGASLVYVLAVVALVPEEIGVPISNARFTPKSLGEGRVKASTQSTPSFPMTDALEAEPPPAPVAVEPARGSDFGRRGFSPPLERPEAPPPPPPPVPPPVVTSPAPPPPAPPDEEAVAATPITPPPPGPGRILKALSGTFRGILPSQSAPAPAPEAPAEGAAPDQPAAETAPAEPDSEPQEQQEAPAEEAQGPPPGQPAED